MVSYYRIHEGNLHPGDIAKASDIIQIQQNTKDMIANVLEDLHDRQGCILGSDENAFVLTPESTRAGRFIDQMNLAEGEDAKYISIREVDYRQPIRLSHSSLYSVIVKMQNKSEKNVNVIFELQDINGRLVKNKRAILELPANTEPTEYEIIFDLKYYPTAHGIVSEDLENNDTENDADDIYDTEYATKWQHLIIPHNDDNDTEGLDYGNESNLASSSLGVSELYLVVKALNKNKFDVHQTDSNGYIWNDEDPTFGILMNKNSSYGQLLEGDAGSGYTTLETPGDLYFKEIFTNSQAYRCEPGEALIGGEKVCLADTHIALDGASSYGDVISYIYMDINGHLRYKNSDPYLGATPSIPQVDEPHLHIANIITYADSSQDPVIYQEDTGQDTRPRSHHERLRRLEKLTAYLQDVSIPPRLKYTLTGESWIDQNPEAYLQADQFNNTVAKTIDALQKGGYSITTDANGNFVVLVSKAETFNIPVTLKSTKSGVTETTKTTTTTDNKTKTIKTKILKSAQTSAYINKLAKDNIERAQVFAEMKNVKVDITNGIMTLASNTTQEYALATTNKQAAKTEFNPWDDSARNRPSSAKVKPTTRSYTVSSGQDGPNDWASEFPAMTLYVDDNYNLKKLEIPIYKFKNCAGVKFIIYKRQDGNDKDNTVWLQQRIWSTGMYSLKKAKIKKGYQYMEDGFTIDFGKNGLTLERGQYVIIALPIAESGEGTMYVDTYKPENSKDFCIRYYGAANASHFLLKTRYQEIWYNPVKATGETVTYDTKGHITSGTVTWTNKEPIKTIKATGNIQTPKGTDYKLEVDTGGGWKEIKLNKVANVNSGKNTFRWRLTLTGNKKKTPTVKYNKKKKYALNFEIKRAAPQTTNTITGAELDKNLCITSVPFDGNNILREYLGDMNFALSDNKLSNFEFARVWATDVNKEALRIDLAGSDRTDYISSLNAYYPIYSMHYVDLKLKDFNDGSVDYSNYDPDMEIDEHNLRFKLDTDYSYNDNSIHLLNISDFKPVITDCVSTIGSTTESLDSESDSESTGTTTIDTTDSTSNGILVDVSKIPSSTVNVTLAKAQIQGTLNLAQYDAIKVGLSLDGQVDGTISGLALYVSSTYETETPSNISNEPNEDVILIDELPDLNKSQQETIDIYANKIVKRFEPVNGTGAYVYYQSRWDSSSEKWVWGLLHNIKSYDIYEIVDRSTNSNTLKITSDNQGKMQYYEINIDPNKINLQYAKEIGLIILNDEGKYSATNVSYVGLHEFATVQQDYYPIFKASDGNKFTMKTSTQDTISRSNATGSISVVGKTEPATSQIVINYNNQDFKNGATIAEFDTTSKNTEFYNHIAIQMASDCFIVKDMFELHLIQIDKETKVEKVIDKIRLPTNNYIYYPTNANTKAINLIDVFKKLETSERFDKLALVVTPKFLNYAQQLKTNDQKQKLNGIAGNQSISLFIGNISLYQARTIPMFHPRMRMKFYFDQATEDEREYITIRKVGVVADYQ